MADVFIEVADREQKIGHFHVNRAKGTVQLIGTEELIVSPELFGERAPEVAGVFAQAFEYGKLHMKRKFQKLADV